jgi:tRNA(Met) C34 N-acetyltransferase TmcA
VIPIHAHVGTDQQFVGRTLARLLKQKRPEGGLVCLLSSNWNWNGQRQQQQHQQYGSNNIIDIEDIERRQGFMDEIMKDNERDDRGHWYEIDLNTISGVSSSLTSTSTSTSIPPTPESYMPTIENCVQKQNATAIVMLTQLPMQASDWPDVVDANRRNARQQLVTYLSVDRYSYQIQHLNQMHGTHYCIASRSWN